MPHFHSPTRPPENTDSHVFWSGLRGSALALALAQRARKLPGPLLILSNDARQGELLLEELSFFLGGDLPLISFPDWETLAYDGFSPHQGITSTRLRTLALLPDLTRGIVVSQLNTATMRLPPKPFISGGSFNYRIGQSLDMDITRRSLIDAGYYSTSQVHEHGEFAIRGSLFDIFPAGSEQPLRIDLFDDEIESLRYFDPDTQRSGDALEELTLLPAREFPLNEPGIRQFRSAFRRRFEGNPSACMIYSHVSEGIAASGAENYLPLFFDQTSTLFDYLPPGTTIAFADSSADELQENLEQTWEELGLRYEQYRHDVSKPILEPCEIALSPEQWLAQAEPFNQIHIQRFKSDGEQSDQVVFDARQLPDLSISADVNRSGRLVQFIESFEGRILIVAESPGRRETVRELLADHKLRPTVVADWQAFFGSGVELALTVAPLQEGMLLSQVNVAVIAENQLFGHSQRRRKRHQKNKDPNAIIRNLNELSDGAPVVHETCGIGRYQGLTILEIDGNKNEFVTIVYAGDDKLYVPVHALHLVSRYLGGAPDKAPLHRLGSDQWEKSRRKAVAKIRDVAADLLDLYARRAARVGRSFAINEADNRAFASTFPFELTADQESAIHAITDDMTSLKPMDRLICGDVGFGKTEVALRAAFICVNQSKQAALLVPTTLLAEQHGKNFEDRFADWPVNVAVLSRFKSKKESDKIIADLNDGKIDIVIGTHKLLQGQIRFRELGLVIIDEEHRFGVRHKEKLKALRAEVDVLTLTATPIPRTLNMAMGGIRDLSLITTPPSERLSIKTFVTQWNDAMIREACLREIKRGGQIYFVHNAVKDIETAAEKLQALVPEATIEIGHGQMKERELEQVMLDFYHRRFNVLLCTTIIESGIDVPTANTIIIDRADRFGLAQLHQIRGRVGRSSHRAYAYLITPPVKAMTADAVKRLEAIESLEDLGAGFTLATHDLEIRGAGELLGDDQSGQIHEVGYTLYMDLLARAVDSLKAGHEPDLGDLPARSSEIELHTPAILPEDYIPDVHTRLVQYKRITSAADDDELRDLKVEMIDRFGLLPEPAGRLFDIALLRQHAQRLGIAKIDCTDQGGRIVFEAKTNADPSQLIRLIQEDPEQFKLSQDNTLRFTCNLESIQKRISYLNALLHQLGAPKAA